MREVIGQRTLWAMHPAALAELLQQNAVEGMLPDGLRAFFSGSQAAAAKPADPVREGSTMILPVEGVLRPRYSATMANAVNEAAADDRVGTIILRVMSPGGTVWGTQEFGDAVFEARQVKPVVAVADSYAFSAAHWVATQASAFYVTPSGQVGSVGVRTGHTDMSGLEDKLGMKTTLIASDPKKIAAHPYAPLSEEDRAEIEAEIAEMNDAFVAAIARGRGIDAAQVPEIHGRGEVFSAKRAAKLGITDGVMSFREVVAKYASPRSRLDLMRRRAALQKLAIDI